jgi:CHAT domain-containing protein/Tfp pilus assembly protein PilF
MRRIKLWLSVVVMALIAVWITRFSDEAARVNLGYDDREILDGLYKEFLFDPPADAQRVRVRIRPRQAASSGDPERVQKRMGWLIPGAEPRVVFTDGESIPAPPEQDRTPVDFLTECKEVKEGKNDVSGDEKDDALTLAAWVYRRGDEALAAQLLASARGGNRDPVADLRYHMAFRAWWGLVGAHFARANGEAVAHGRRLLNLYSRIAADLFPQAAHLVAEAERRQKQGTSDKIPSGEWADDFANWETARKVAYLIEVLEEVDAGERGAPHTVHFHDDYRIRALVEIGDPAVIPLIDALEGDTRLTRYIGEPQEFSVGKIHAVREAEREALRQILHLETLEPGEHSSLSVSTDRDVKITVAQLRRYWEKQGRYPLDQRLMNMLLAPESTDAMRLQAARGLTGAVGHGLLIRWVRWNEVTPHPVAARFNNPTVGEAILAALEDRMQSRERSGPPSKARWVPWTDPESKYLEALINLGDARLGARLAAHAHRQTELARRQQYATTAHLLGDSSELITLADEVRSGQLPVAELTQAIQQQYHPTADAFCDLLEAFVHSALSEAERALEALAHPGHRFHLLARHLLLTKSVDSRDHKSLFEHPFCVALLRHALEDTSLTGVEVQVSPTEVSEVQQRVCDQAMRVLDTLVLGLPCLDPLRKDAPWKAFRVLPGDQRAIAEWLDTFGRRLRPATAGEKSRLWSMYYETRLIPDLRPLGRPATAEDVKAGRAVFHLDGKGKLAEGVRLPAWLVLQKDAADEHWASLAVQAETGPYGEVVYGVIERRGMRRVRANEAARVEPVDALAGTYPQIVALGDSITRGIRQGVKAEETFTALLGAELGKHKVDARMVNAGIGGERTDQALKRLTVAVLAAKTKAVLIMYGTNDSYVDRDRKDSRLTAEQYRANLKELVARLRNAGSEPVLMTPPRWGERGSPQRRRRTPQRAAGAVCEGLPGGGSRAEGAAGGPLRPLVEGGLRGHRPGHLDHGPVPPQPARPPRAGRADPARIGGAPAQSGHTEVSTEGMGRSRALVSRECGHASAVTDSQEYRMRLFIAPVLLVGLVFPVQGQDRELTEAEKLKLATEAVKQTQEGFQHLERRRLTESAECFEKALAASRKFYPKTTYPNGHPNFAAILSNLGLVRQLQGAYEEARTHYEEALAMDRKHYPDGHADLATSLNNLGAVLHAQGAYHQARELYQESLDMTRKLYPEAKYPNGHPEILSSLNNLATLLQAEGSYEQARTAFEQTLAMARKLYPEADHPNGHPDLARAHNNLGHLFRNLGAYDSARTHYEQALAMLRQCYPESKFPNGHPDLSLCLNNLGLLLMFQGAGVQAGPYLEQALAMRRKLYPEARYPNGHPDLAASLVDLAFQLHSQRSSDKARMYCEQALAMGRKLYPEARYPDGHPFLAMGLSSTGVVLMYQGHPEEGRSYLEQALAMRRKLYPEAHYPDGHPQLADTLFGLGTLFRSQGAPETARSYFEQALAMQSQLTRRTFLVTSEAEALAFVQTALFHQLPRDSYLSTLALLPGTDAAAYRAMWNSKAAVTRLLEMHQASARAAGSRATARITRLKEVRRRIEQLLQETRLKPAVRDRELAQYADERDRLERELAKDLPILARWDEREKQTPDDLARALPPGAVFVDTLAYSRCEIDPAVKDRGGEKITPSYLAFVIAPGQPVRRVELGAAEPIHQAVRAWREAIEKGTDSRAAEELGKRVWEPIARHLPPGARTLYLAADGDLGRVPWAALPVSRDRVLLEELSLATVPHGPFLLEQLQNPPKQTGADTVLALGDVTYGTPAWPALPGTRLEIEALAPLAPAAVVTLSKTKATAALLAETLPTVRYAHIATHGEFRAAELAAEKKREQEALASWREGLGAEGRRVAARNPQGYVGLVLANGELLTGLRLLDLPLDNLKLVTLSACETGLGEYTGGEGVQGLQRAFHLAGCPNVVASLWKVNDAATAALMAQFYHELWVNKKPPIEALREAQLTIYRHPERIAALAGERGRPALAAAARLGSAATAKPDEKPKTTPTRLWAAFVLSGVGTAK